MRARAAYPFSAFVPSAWRHGADLLWPPADRLGLRLLEDIAQALHHAAACLTEYGEWSDETSRVTGHRGDSWMFARSLTTDSVEEWLAYQRAAR